MTIDGVRAAIALLEDTGQLKPAQDEHRRANAWHAVLDAAITDGDLNRACQAIARSTEKVYGQITPKHVNLECMRIRTDRLKEWLKRYEALKYGGTPYSEAVYTRAVYAAISDGCTPEQADREGQAAVDMAIAVAEEEPNTNPFELLNRISAKIKAGERPWRAHAHKYAANQPPCQIRGGRPGGRTYNQVIAQLNERNNR